MLKESELADNIDPRQPKIDEPNERSRIMRTFERSVSKPAACVLSGQRDGGRCWLPGDSPIGSRLPLKSLPYFKPADYPHLVPADPFAERGELPEAPAVAIAVATRGSAAVALAPPPAGGS